MLDIVVFQITECTEDRIQTKYCCSSVLFVEFEILQFKINYWTVEITCRIAVLIKYISNQKNGGFHSFILNTARALQGGIEGNYETDMH